MLRSSSAQGRERAAAAERVPGEVGELEQQLAGAVGVGAGEGRDGAEAVVDEVRADLRAQGPQLGLHEPGALAFELGQLDLRGDPAGHLLGGPDQPGGDDRPVCGERGDDLLVRDDRGQDPGADGAVGVVARDVPLVEHHGAPGRQDRLRVLVDRLAVVRADAVPGEDGVGVGERHGPAAEHRPQLPGGLLGALGGEAVAQEPGGEGGAVQRLVRRPVDLADEPAPAQEPDQPDDGGGQDQPGEERRDMVPVHGGSVGGVGRAGADWRWTHTVRPCPTSPPGSAR